MLTIQIDKFCGLRIKYACVPHWEMPEVLVECEDADYNLGYLPPNYPVPATMGQVIYDWWLGHGMVYIEDIDDTFDPVFTWTECLGIWPSTSPNLRVNCT